MDAREGEVRGGPLRIGRDDRVQRGDRLVRTPQPEQRHPLHLARVQHRGLSASTFLERRQRVRVAALLAQDGRVAVRLVHADLVLRVRERPRVTGAGALSAA